jgi:hypothetical protein
MYRTERRSTGKYSRAPNSDREIQPKADLEPSGLSEAVKNHIAEAGGGRSGRQHQQPCEHQPGIVLGLSDCDGASATRCPVHELKSHFRRRQDNRVSGQPATHILAKLLKTGI